MKKILSFLTAFLILSSTAFAACDSETKLLLHADGADASTTFTDSSLTGRTVTANGNAQLDTAQKKFGTASGLFDGTGDYLTASDSADFDFGTGDFTIDTWIRFNGSVGAAAIYHHQDGGYGSGLLWAYTGANMNLYINSGVAFKSEAWSPAADTWYHVALVRNGTSVVQYVNGTALGAAGTSSANITSTSDLNIGRDAISSTWHLNGWYDEYRVSKGIARWTANFTPETSAYCAASNTSGMFLCLE